MKPSGEWRKLKCWNPVRVPTRHVFSLFRGVGAADCTQTVHIWAPSGALFCWWPVCSGGSFSKLGCGVWLVICSLPDTVELHDLKRISADEAAIEKALTLPTAPPQGNITGGRRPGTD
jgi:hypothetical protein